MTLIELLVVISILMILTVMVVPRLQPAAEERAIREAARTVNIYLNAARNQAVASGRPVGVLFRRNEATPNAATILEQVEIPAVYAGETINAAVRVQDWTIANPNVTPPTYYWPGMTVLKVRVRVGELSNGLIRRGDLVKLNQQGPTYRIEKDSADNSDFLTTDSPTVLVDGSGFIRFADATDANGDTWSDEQLTLVASLDMVPQTPWPKHPGTNPPAPWSNPVSFAIARQPYFSVAGGSFAAMCSAVEPLQLPSRTAVDLAFSGRDGMLWGGGPGAEFQQSSATDTSAVVIMFSPTGSVAAVYRGNQGPLPATGPIFLLIGKWARMADLDGPGGVPDNIPDGGDDELTNLQDITNFWVSISPQSGLVTTSEMGAQTDPAISDLQEARQYAQQSQSKGGR